MANINIIGPGSGLPTAFSYDPDNPTYFLEWLSWLQLKNLQAMETAGMIAADITDSASVLIGNERLQVGIEQGLAETLKISVPQLPGEAIRVRPFQEVNEYFVVRPNQAESDTFSVNFPAYTAENPLWTQAVAALPEDFPAGLWAAQNAYIADFNRYLDDVHIMLEKKREQYPEAESMWQQVMDTFSGWLDDAMVILGSGLASSILALFAAGSWKMGMIGMATLAGCAAAYDLIKKALSAQENITKHKAVNNELLTLPKSRENYLLRLKTISIQQMDIHNRLTEILALESSIQEATKGQGGEPVDEKGTLADVVKALNDLAMNTEEIDLGGIRILHSAKVVSVVG